MIAGSRWAATVKSEAKEMISDDGADDDVEYDKV